MTINIEETLQLFSEKAGESWFLRRQSDGQYAIVKGNEIYAVFDADELDEAENKLEELNSSIQEDLEHQPDLFDKTLGSFYLEGDEVKVEKAKDGSKNFIFSPKVGNYLEVLYSALIQCLPYLGFPCIFNAFQAIKELA